MASIEEKVEERYKSRLDSLGVRHYGKTEKVNDAISKALKSSDSKSGNSGRNFPDIQVLLDDGHSRRIPVVIEAKGVKNRLEKLDKNGEIVGVTVYEKDAVRKDGTVIHKKGDLNHSAVTGYAVNGALHYGRVILFGTDYEEVIIVGVNGTMLDKDGKVMDAECKAYYVSKKNNLVPRLITKISADDWSLFKKENIDTLYGILDRLTLTDDEIVEITKKTEIEFESKIKAIHQSLYEDERLRTYISTNDKLYLFCGLIMAGLKQDGVAVLDPSELRGNTSQRNNDGQVILRSIESFLESKGCPEDKIDKIFASLKQVFTKEGLWYPDNGVSLLKTLYTQVRMDIIPYLESSLHLDFIGKILNSLNDWVRIENDTYNDVVLTPRYVTTLMANMARTNMDSFVWDSTMGSGGFLISAMNIMINDAKNKITDIDALEAKIKNIKQNQLLGIEILDNIYMLAVLNMILMGDGSSGVLNQDSHGYTLKSDFPANVFLLNPPYSAKGKGFIFVDEALPQMHTGYACVLIQDSAGSGQGLPYTKHILENNTLIASIKMPPGLFGNKASVSVCIFVFKIGRSHEEDDLVTFIDFSEDGYLRQNRKKSSQEVNLRNVDDADGRYAEVLALVLGKKPSTKYYTEENGKLIYDTISLDGNDWLFSQHHKVNTIPTEEDFKKVVADYLSWKVSCFMKGIG